MTRKKRLEAFVRRYSETFCYLAVVVLLYVAAVVTYLLVREVMR